MRYKLSCFIAILILSLFGILGLKKIINNNKATYINIENEKKYVALSFDDGPNPETTEYLLDELKKREVKATFFVIGKKAEEFPEIITRMDMENHIVGNHSYSHANLSQMSLEEAKDEIEKTNQIIENIINKPVLFLRPPFGAWNNQLDEVVDMFVVEWDIDPHDWQTNSVNTIYSRIIRVIDDNYIILLHDIYDSSVNVAIKLIDSLIKDGYEFVTVDEILGLN